jgi:site-specific DNA-methyltransferase (adenine-specific)
LGKATEWEVIDLRLGDCLEVLKTLPENSVDMIFTDPPYGHNNNNGDLINRREAALGLVKEVKPEAARPIANDGPEANEIVRAVFGEASRLLVPGGCCCCCCCGGGGPDPQFARWSLWLDEVLDFKQMVVWDKGPMGMGWHYRRSYETVLVAQKRGNACKWYDTSHKIENVIRHIRKIIPNKNEHPTLKPVELAEWFLRLHSQAGEIVLDPFMGSGTTGVACVQTGRRFIGIEIDEGYFKIAQRRIEQAQQQLSLLSA